MSKMDTWFRKHDPRKPKDPAKAFVFKEGYPVVVLRPENAAMKLAAVAAIQVGTPHAEARKAFDAALNAQPHQFVGYLSNMKAAMGDGMFSAPAGRIVDKWGRDVGAVEPGDSFCGGPQFAPPVFMQSGHFHKEVWDGRTVLVLPSPGLTKDSNTGIILESSDASERAAIAIRPGGPSEIDCDIPTLNYFMTGDRNKAWNGA